MFIRKKISSFVEQNITIHKTKQSIDWTIRVLTFQLADEAEAVSHHVPHPPANKQSGHRHTSSRRHQIKRPVLPEKYQGYEALLEEDDAPLPPVKEGGKMV